MRPSRPSPRMITYAVEMFACSALEYLLIPHQNIHLFNPGTFNCSALEHSPVQPWNVHLFGLSTFTSFNYHPYSLPFPTIKIYHCLPSLPFPSYYFSS